MLLIEYKWPRVEKENFLSVQGRVYVDNTHYILLGGLLFCKDLFCSIKSNGK